MTNISARSAFVALFDVLAFRQRRQELGTDRVFQIYERGLLPSIQHAAANASKLETRDGKEVSVPDFGPQSVAYKVISDTIIFHTSDDTFGSFLNIVLASQRLLQAGFGASTYPMRGALGWGDLATDGKDILVGSAIEDAYIGEQMQLWAGAMVTEHCESHIQNSGYLDRLLNISHEFRDYKLSESQIKNLQEKSSTLRKYKLPLKNQPDHDVRKRIVFDWTLGMYKGASKKIFVLLQTFIRTHYKRTLRILNLGQEVIA